MLLRFALAASLASSALCLPTISVKGSKFFTSDGNQFYLKGVAYQLTNDDPLANSDQCKLDAALMQTLGANSIRVYHVDPTANHDSCMQTFSDAGIYAWIDLDTFSTYILGPGISTPMWNSTQYEAYQAVMDTFHTYDNVAGFFVGNEVLTTPESSVAAPYVKAAARDMKAYRDKKGYRDIPVGYTAADVSALRPMLQNYLACGTNSSDTVDFYGLNAYEWCGQSTYQTSGYQFLQQNASSYNIPIYFSETGCNTPAPRTFDDQSAIFGSDMDGTWSGAIIYEWIQEVSSSTYSPFRSLLSHCIILTLPQENNYGLISYGPSATGDAATNTAVVGGYTRTGSPIPISPDFSNLSNQWATLSPSGVKSSDYSPSGTPPACPAFTTGAWSVDPSASLPTLNQAYVSSGASASSGAASTSAAASGSATASGSAASASSSAVKGAASPAAVAGAAAWGLEVFVVSLLMVVGFL